MKNSFNNICSFRKKYPGENGYAINFGDARLAGIKTDLDNLKRYLESHFQNYRGITYDFKVSNGYNNFPFVLYVCILPPEQSIPRGVYVGICFDTLGRGAVAGCMESVTSRMGLNVIKRMKNPEKWIINVNGSSRNTKYNNAYANPVEFYFPLNCANALHQHVEKSIDLTLFELSRIE